MIAYRYQALDPQGNRVSGEIHAPNTEAVEAKLEEKRLSPLYVVRKDDSQKTKPSPESPTAVPQLKSNPLFQRDKLKLDESIDLLRSLQVMVRSGVTLVEALETIADHASSPVVQKTARTVKDAVLQGASLDTAMRKVPNAFPEIVCEMVAVAEEGGRLAYSLQGAIDYLEQSAHTRKTVGGALIYPVVLVGICFATFFLFVVFILPTFGKTFEGLEVKLPLTTTFLLNLGTFLQDRLPWVAATAVAAAFAIRALVKAPATRGYVANLTYRLPLFGTVLQLLAVSRALQTFGSLLATNIPVIRAIQYAGRVAAYPPLTSAFGSVETAVRNGENIADAMQKTHAFPPMIIQLVSVGEKSGQLPDLLVTSAEQLRDSAQRKMKSALSLFEPLLILMMGAVVGLLTLSILLPLFTLNQSVR